MPRTDARPLTVSLEGSPAGVAARLRRLPGLVWLDTAGNVPDEGARGAISVIAAAPAAWVRGRMPDTAPLEQALAALRETTLPAVDWGLPLAGLFGAVDYDGRYCFGVYDEVLIYRHATGEWMATGPRLPVLARQEDPDGPAPGPLPQFAPLMKMDDFCAMARRAQEYIAAGDIYQVNLSHRYEAAWPDGADPFALALRLREASPAPYAAYLDLDGRRIVSSSPEMFLHMSGSVIRTRPVKGTRPRFADPREDERSLTDLITSEKERAELIMITDLLRHDLGQVCEFGSVNVTGLLKPEEYEQVFHLVSTVRGVLRPEVSHAAALQACLPGGSVTGAPKVRACEIIAELEPVPRGLYTGAIGYLGANGESQFSIAIRTVEIENGIAGFGTGAGIVADSVPAFEWEETLHKAAGILAATRNR